MSERTVFGPAHPHLFVGDVPTAAAWYERVLGFTTLYLHGDPPFFGEIAREAAILNLRHLDTSPFIPGRRDAEQLLSAWIEVTGIYAVHARCVVQSADIVMPPTRQSWGHIQFIVRDPDGNLIALSSPA